MGDGQMTEIDWIRMGMRIRDVRNQRGISLKELGTRVRVQEPSISNIERSRAHPSLEVLIRIVEALDISLDYIVFGIRPLHSSDGLVFRSDDELDEQFRLTEK